MRKKKVKEGDEMLPKYLLRIRRPKSERLAGLTKFEKDNPLRELGMVIVREGRAWGNTSRLEELGMDPEDILKLLENTEMAEVLREVDLTKIPDTLLRALLRG